MEVRNYKLESREGYQRVAMPKDAKIIRVEVQRDQVCLWAIVPDDTVPHLSRLMAESKSIDVRERSVRERVSK